MPHIEPTQQAGRALFERGIEGPIVMLNLLRYREQADYSKSPQLAPEAPISGKEAYARYMQATLPLLEAAGGELVFIGDGGQHLIGPADEPWDLVLLVRHRSLQTFMSFATNADYLAIAGHRTAALADSRLLPIEQR
ncbi:MAG: DUF1330 domain-containing protein [Myxococcales bacterium]|nr:DUF1330 domain-containing protein [Myxococcales bacterium]